MGTVEHVLSNNTFETSNRKGGPYTVLEYGFRLKVEYASENNCFDSSPVLKDHFAYPRCGCLRLVSNRLSNIQVTLLQDEESITK